MPAIPRVFALSVHAAYACRHSGACCRAGWAIPVEPSRRAVLGGDLLVPGTDGACPHYDRPARRCRVHREHGEAMLPTACHQFPRRALVDERGVFVTLSHFCPTAAGLLVQHRDPLEVVEGPAAFPPEREYDGLDGRGAWPPLIKPDRLFDHEGFDAWQRHLVAELAVADADPGASLRRIAAAAEQVRRWHPSDGSLAGWIRALPSRAWSASELSAAWARYRPFAALEAYDRVRACVPDGLEAPRAPDAEAPPWALSSGSEAAAVASRYLAAKAFGSWAAYEASGVRTMVAELVVADLVLRVEAARRSPTAGGALGGAAPASDAYGRRATNALGDDALVESVRAADWLLVHLVDRPALLAWLGAAERDGRGQPAAGADCQTARPTKNGPSRSR